SSAHECWRPTQTFFTPATPVTCTGLELDIIVLFPSWNLSFSPQHQTLPSLSAAQLCAPPPLDSFFTVAGSITLVGIGRSVVVLSPTCPEPFEPQHCTEPSTISAHVCSSPPWILLAAPSSPFTSEGVGWSCVVPSPSCPRALAPQQ